MMQLERSSKYDFIKGVAIIAIVVLHSLPHASLQAIFAPWHIWHSTPIFVIVSGALAATRKRRTVFDLYNITRSVRKLILPAVTVWIVQIAVVTLYGGKINHYTVELLKRGGFGPGGYFIYIAIQITLFAGLCGLLFQRLGIRALALLFVVSFSFDILSIVHNIDPQVYRSLSFRYMVHFGIGFSYAMGLWDDRLQWIAFLVGISVLPLYWISHMGVNLPPVYPHWGTHTAATSFYSYALFLGITRFHKKLLNSRIVLVLCFVGARSYSIFLFQMLYFWVKRGVQTRTSLSLSPLPDVLLAVLSCIVGGLAFSWAMKITRSFVRSGIVDRERDG